MQTSSYIEFDSEGRLPCATCQKPGDIQERDDGSAMVSCPDGHLTPFWEIANYAIGPTVTGDSPVRLVEGCYLQQPFRNIVLDELLAAQAGWTYQEGKPITLVTPRTSDPLRLARIVGHCFNALKYQCDRDSKVREANLSEDSFTEKLKLAVPDIVADNNLLLQQIKWIRDQMEHTKGQITQWPTPAFVHTERAKRFWDPSPHRLTYAFTVEIYSVTLRSIRTMIGEIPETYQAQWEDLAPPRQP